MEKITLLIACFVLIGASAPQPEFPQLDKDGNGFIEREESRDHEAFNRIDTDDNKVVTRAEFEAWRNVLPAPAAVDKTVHEDIVYYSDQQLHTLGIHNTSHVSLDIYEPGHGDQLPVILFVHGGSWQRGDKKSVSYKPDYFLASGFVFASTNYRMRPDVSIDTLQQDVAAAVAWLHKNVERYGGDPDNIFLVGHSAGAHLVSIVGTRADLLDKYELGLDDLAGVVELDTMALDVLLMMETGENFYGPIFGTDPEALVEVSPWHHIQTEVDTPPFLFVVADGNERKLMQSTRMAEKLKSAGADAEVVEAPNRTHRTLNRSLGGIGDEYGPMVLAFLRRHIR